MQNKHISPIIVAFSTLAVNYGTRGSFGLFLKPLKVLSQEAAYATDRGISLTGAAWALGLISGIGMIASPGVRWVSDRVRSKKKLEALILVMAVFGVALIFVARSGFVLALGPILVGTVYFSYVPILPSITRSLFGKDFFGRVWGLISMGGSIGAALGIWLGGYFHDLYGNYDLFWLVLSLCFLAASAALLLVDTEHRKDEGNPAKRGTDGRFSAAC